jgi:hypothetical protein
MDGRVVRHQTLRRFCDVSHIVTIQTEVRDPTAVCAACDRLRLPAPAFGTAQLFNAEETGLLVRLSGWRYPLVCQTESGRLAYDNYRGAWGEQRELDRFLQAYAIEKARLEARKQGHDVQETALADGSVQLTIQVGGSR